MKTHNRHRLSLPTRFHTEPGFRQSTYSPKAAQLIIDRRHGTVNVAELAATETRAKQNGFEAMVTTALSPAEQKVFARQGYEPVEELTVLSRTVGKVSTSELHPVRDAIEIDMDEILEIDRASFSESWTFDVETIRDALNATPKSRFRVTEDANGITGYAITGRARRQGYLQRLAVAPRARHRSFGRSLVIDSLRWLHRWRSHSVVVNTQLDNAPARFLYESLGFRLEDYRLAILKKSFQ